MKYLLMLFLLAIAEDYLGKGNTRGDAAKLISHSRKFGRTHADRDTILQRYSHATNKKMHESRQGEDPGSIPESFDAREKWRRCSSIREIPHQGDCNSCYAVAVTSVMSDRTCIMSNGRDQFRYSARNLATCCEKCGNIIYGGLLGPSFDYWHKVGIVSGSYMDLGCQPYRAEDMETCKWNRSCPQCKDKCDQGFTGNYESDLRHAERIYNVRNDVSAIQEEIMKHGPVAAAIYYNNQSDFDSYPNVMECSGTSEGHAVRIIGWGREKSGSRKKYWLAANSYGIRNMPIMKIKQGSCYIQDNVWAGIPYLH